MTSSLVDYRVARLRPARAHVRPVSDRGTTQLKARRPVARTILPRMADTVGFIGLGLMGRPMAKNLLKAGFPLVVNSRSPTPVDDLVASGAVRASSPADVARRATRIFTMVPDSPDVELVLDGPEGVFSAMQAGTILIDASTIAPSTARRLAARAASLGATMLDAPVSGGDIGAENGTLSIMVGGEQTAFDAVKPLLDVMGNPERVVWGNFLASSGLFVDTIDLCASTEPRAPNGRCGFR